MRIREIEFPISNDKFTKLIFDQKQEIERLRKALSDENSRKAAMKKLCKNCKHCRVIGMYGVYQAICMRPDDLTGIPRHQECNAERSRQCGADAKYFEVRELIPKRSLWDRIFKKGKIRIQKF